MEFIFVFSPRINLCIFVLAMMAAAVAAGAIICYCDRMIRYAIRRTRRKWRVRHV